MKKVLFFLLVLLLVNTVSASHIKSDIAISEFTKHIYNLGDILSISYSVSQQSDVSAIFKLKLECGNYSLDYFTQPVELKEHETKDIPAASLTLQGSMAGNCIINASLFSTSNEILATQSSDTFIVTSELQFEADSDKKEYMPGENVAITLNISPTYESFNGEAEFLLGNERETANATGNMPTYSIKTANNTKTGKHDLSIIVKDEFGNKGERIVQFAILAVPTKLEVNVNSQIFKPGQTLRAFAALKDQANDPVTGHKAQLLIISPNKKIILNTSEDLGEVLSYKFAQDAVPGNYSVEAAVLGLEATAMVSIEEVEQIETTFDNRIIKITNTGNIDYNKPVNISLIKEGKTYSIIRKLSLSPSEPYEIDLFKELPEGSYNITVPNKGEVAVYQDVSIQDERSLGKKIGDVFSPLTGSTVKGDAGSFVKNTVFLLIAFLAVAFLTITAVRMYRSRKRGSERKEMQLQKEVKNAAEMSEKVMQQKQQEKPVYAQKIITKQPEEKKSLLRDDPEIKRFVDRVLREK